MERISDLSFRNRLSSTFPTGVSMQPPGRRENLNLLSVFASSPEKRMFQLFSSLAFLCFWFFGGVWGGGSTGITFCLFLVFQSEFSCTFSTVTCAG